MTCFPHPIRARLASEHTTVSGVAWLMLRCRALSVRMRLGQTTLRKPSCIIHFKVAAVKSISDNCEEGGKEGNRFRRRALLPGRGAAE